MGNTFCSYFTQDTKQVLLKVEQAWSTWLVSFLGSVILFLLVTETFSGTVALTLTLENLSNGSFRGDGDWSGRGKLGPM